MSSGESLLVKIGSQMCNSVETCHNFSTFLCWKLHAWGIGFTQLGCMSAGCLTAGLAWLAWEAHAFQSMVGDVNSSFLNIRFLLSILWCKAVHVMGLRGI